MGRRRLRADLPRGVGSSRFRAHTGGREPSPPLRHLEGVPHHGFRPALLLTLLLPACAVEDGGRAPGLDDGGSACSGGKCDHTEQHSACSDTTIPICERFEACLGDGWGPEDEEWKFEYFQAGDERRCLAYRTAAASVRPVDSDGALGFALLESVALDPEDVWQEGKAACMVLQESLELCRASEYAESWDGVQATRMSSCHPGAEVECERHQPDFAAILANAVPPQSFTGGTQTSVATYCSGQAAANCTAEPCGYALEHPLFPVEWACDEGDVDILEQRVRSELGGAVFGYAWTVDLGLDLTLPDNAELQGNQCRLTKALLDCVMPNLGASQLCTLSDGNTGVEYPDTLPGYCLRIHNTTGAWAHGARRAVDFNVPTNSGNIVGCSSGKVLDPEASDYWEEYLCTNRSETARLDLPPRFVSLMEGCGFSWGGHWGDPAGDAEAEGRHLGCDPMHFELPE